MRLALGDPANIDGIMTRLGNDRFPNMGILYLIGYLRENMPGSTSIYLKGGLELEPYLDMLGEFNPQVFGISFSSWVSETAFKTIKAVKDRFPEIIVICGGTHPTVDPKGVLEKTDADFCVIGEGEQTLLELMNYYEHGRGSLAEINGIAYKENGTVQVTKPRKHIKDIDTIPLPAWDIIDFADYEGLGYCKSKPNTAMIFSRGCPYYCSYCSNPVWRSSKPWLRLRSPENIQREVAMLYNRGIREIWIRADEFNSNLKWTLEVCRLIKELNFGDLYFRCNLRADKVNDGLAEAFKEINVWMINLGVESLNQRVLNGIEKKVTVDQIINSCKVLKKHGIDVYTWLMYYQMWEENGELCWETPKEVDNTLRMTKKLHRQGLVDLMSWQIATPIPGSKLFEVAKKHGVISVPDQFNVWNVSTSIPGVSERQIHIHRLKGMLLQAYMAYKKGRVGWKTRRNIKGRLFYMANAVVNILRPNSSEGKHESS